MLDLAVSEQISIPFVFFFAEELSYHVWVRFDQLGTLNTILAGSGADSALGSEGRVFVGGLIPGSVLLALALRVLS